jgi:opacity protein-like surface antigen
MLKLTTLKYAVLLVFCFLSLTAWSQERKLINYTEVGALIHISNSAGGSAVNAFRTRTGISRIIQNHFGLGFALGTDNYRRTNAGSYNTLPLTLNASYFFNPDFSGLKADVYGGYAVKLFNEFNKGLTAGAGLSYSVPLNNGLNLGLQTGYNYQEINYPMSFIENSFTIGTLRLGVGLTFK